MPQKKGKKRRRPTDNSTMVCFSTTKKQLFVPGYRSIRYASLSSPFWEELKLPLQHFLTHTFQQLFFFRFIQARRRGMLPRRLKIVFFCIFSAVSPQVSTQFSTVSSQWPLERCLVSIVIR